jgi:hypothetical protein
LPGRARVTGNDNINGAKVEWGLTDSAGRVSIDGLGVKSTSPETSEAGPALASDGSLGWRGSGNDALNVGEGVWNVETTTLSESSDVAPALAWLSRGIYLAWKGAGNDNLNAMAVAGGAKLLNQTAAVTFGASSSHSPALAAHAGRVYLAWKGSGNEELNVARIELDAELFPGSLSVGGLEAKQVFPDDTTEEAPALVSHGGRLLLAWKGAGNDNLNIAQVPA